MKLFKTYIPYLAVGAAAFVFAILSEWNDDAIAYSFYIPGSGEDESFTPIATLRDIWESQINHYSNSNGRFVAHFIVQIFCGLLSKPWFAVINAFAWMALVFCITRFSNNAKDFRTSSLAAILAILLFFTLPFTPPFQINYVWTACALLIWLRCFFSQKKETSVGLVLLMIFSFLTGEMHEGFSIPAGGCSAVLPCHAQGKIHLQGMVSVAVIRSRCPHINIRTGQFPENKSAPGCGRLLAEYFRAAARTDLVSGCFPYNIPFP